MSSEKVPVTPGLIWTSGFLLGMSIEGAKAIGASAKVDAEPHVGPFVATVLMWLAFALWLAIMALLIRWFLSRSFVRNWFVAAEKKSIES